jgi:type I restriction-modification system DNA methylase subunit
MPLFQPSIVKKYLQSIDKSILDAAYIKYNAYFHNSTIQTNIKEAKEEQFQEGFLRELFGNILGYTLNPNPNYNLTTELKNVSNSKKVDGAIVFNTKAVAVIELKGTDTTDLAKIETQAFGYKNNQPECVYVITSNFEKLRFYIDNAIDFIEFNLFNLNKDDFAVLYVCLSISSIQQNLPKNLKDESVSKESTITNQLYKDYSNFKRALFNDIVAQNTQYDKLLLFKKTQKLLDRFLFIFFAEDRLLLPTNLIRRINLEWDNLQKMRMPVSLYDRYKMYFNDLNAGAQVTLPAFGKKTGDAIEAKFEIFAYNGGLFQADDVLDALIIKDTLLYEYTHKLSDYNFESEVDVNILGHIFENSLNEIDEIKTELEGGTLDKTKTKRKKDGVFYTPKYITKYIVENTVGKLCTEKKEALQLNEVDYSYDKRKKDKKELLEKLDAYRNWLLQLTICDPACGSGAFLNQALEFLITEHRYLDELKAKVLGDSLVLSDIENSILENNLFGVDLNDESTEIAKLSLWLRTARRNRKLNSLTNNIKCGNSLIDDPAVAGDKAFNWEKEFPQVFAKGGFDVVIGNPPYGAKLDENDISYYRNKYESVIGHSEVYYIFSEKAITKLNRKDGLIGFIIPNAWLSNKYAKRLREMFIVDTTILNLINFNRQIIFEDANVETSIFILKNTNPQLNNEVFVGQDLKSQYLFLQQEWLKNENYLISFASNDKIDIILKKVNSAEFRLHEKLDISNGYKPYQAGYGLNLNQNPLSVEDVNNKIYHSNKLIDETFKREIKGKGVKRYSLEWDENYIKWGKWLMSPKGSHYFEQTKILVRQVISDYLFAYLDDEKYYADQSLYVCTNYKDRNDSLEFYTALLNSKLYGFFFRKFYSEEDDLFPKIKVNELKNLPIKDTDNNFKKELSRLSQSMVESTKYIKSNSKKFITYFSSQYKLEKLSTKLEKWYDLDFVDFIKELNKAIKTVKGTALTKKEEFDWIELFEDNKKKALALKFEIDKIDKEIDQMVYQLYDLTDEEINIVEEAGK